MGKPERGSEEVERWLVEAASLELILGMVRAFWCAFLVGAGVGG